MRCLDLLKTCGKVTIVLADVALTGFLAVMPFPAVPAQFPRPGAYLFLTCRCFACVPINIKFEEVGELQYFENLRNPRWLIPFL